MHMGRWNQSIAVSVKMWWTVALKPPACAPSRFFPSDRLCLTLARLFDGFYQILSAINKSAKGRQQFRKTVWAGHALECVFLNPTFQPLIIVCFEDLSRKLAVLKISADEIDPDRPTRIIDRTNSDPSLMLPLAVALRRIPPLEPSPHV
jgi:hypothetical protein